MIGIRLIGRAFGGFWLSFGTVNKKFLAQVILVVFF